MANRVSSQDRVTGTAATLDAGRQDLTLVVQCLEQREAEHRAAMAQAREPRRMSALEAAFDDAPAIVIKQWRELVKAVIAPRPRRLVAERLTPEGTAPAVWSFALCGVGEVLVKLTDQRQLRLELRWLFAKGATLQRTVPVHNESDIVDAVFASLTDLIKEDNP